MSEKITNIAKNTSYFTFALIMQKVISFSYFIILARNLAPENLGKYYLAISFTTIFAIFIDMGLANVLTREVAKTRENAGKLINNILTIKIPLFLICFIAVIVLANISGYPEITRHLIYLAAIPMVLDSFTVSFFAVIRGHHNLIFESIASVLVPLIMLVFGFIALKLSDSLIPLMLTLVLASVFNFIYALIVIIKKFKIKLKPEFDKKFIKLIIKITAPFALFAIFQRIYTNLDTVLLSILAGDKSAGLYQIAFKIIFALQFLPMAFTASLYPAFSLYWSKNREQLSISFARAINYLIIISLPISAGIIVLVDKIIRLFKPEYLESILPLQIIMASPFFIFLNFPIGSLLNACDRQAVNTRNMGIVLLLSIALNLIFIPKWQETGASITVLITNLIMFVLGLYYIPKITKIYFLKIGKILLKSTIAVSYMGVFAFSFKNDINIFIIVILSSIIYFVLLYLLGGFKKEDVISIWNSFANVKKLG